MSGLSGLFTGTLLHLSPFLRLSHSHISVALWGEAGFSVGKRADGGGNGQSRIRTGAIWRSSPGKRGARLHAALVARPGSCVRRLGGDRAGEMQFRRLLHNRSVTDTEMSLHAGELTGRRAAGRHVVVVQDTSELNLGSRRSHRHYGPVAKGNAAGLLLHASLAVEAGTQALLGMVSMQVWNRGRGELAPRRKRATASKESQRWIENTQQAGEVLAGAASLTMVSDRESDFYELFAQRPQNVELVVRACQNRRIERAEEEDPDLLFTFIDAQAEQGRFVMTIPAAPGRRERTAEFAVRFAPVAVRRPR